MTIVAPLVYFYLAGGTGYLLHRMVYAWRHRDLVREQIATLRASVRRPIGTWLIVLIGAALFAVAFVTWPFGLTVELRAWVRGRRLADRFGGTAPCTCRRCGHAAPKPAFVRASLGEEFVVDLALVCPLCESTEVAS